jgi:hypothetical protein
MIATVDPITAARAAALFVSDLSATRRPTRAEVEASIKQALRTHGGTRGCAADVAAAYGDHPELAAPRMRWARSIVENLYERHTAADVHTLSRPAGADRRAKDRYLAAAA